MNEQNLKYDEVLDLYYKLPESLENKTDPFEHEVFSALTEEGVSFFDKNQNMIDRLTVNSVVSVAVKKIVDFLFQYNMHYSDQYINAFQIDKKDLDFEIAEKIISYIYPKQDVKPEKESSLLNMFSKAIKTPFKSVFRAQIDSPWEKNENKTNIAGIEIIFTIYNIKVFLKTYDDIENISVTIETSGPNYDIETSYEPYRGDLAFSDSNIKEIPTWVLDFWNKKFYKARRLSIGNLWGNGQLIQFISEENWKKCMEIGKKYNMIRIFELLFGNPHIPVIQNMKETPETLVALEWLEEYIKSILFVDKINPNLIYDKYLNCYYSKSYLKDEYYIFHPEISNGPLYHLTFGKFVSHILKITYERICKGMVYEDSHINEYSMKSIVGDFLNCLKERIYPSNGLHIKDFDKSDILIGFYNRILESQPILSFHFDVQYLNDNKELIKNGDMIISLTNTHISVKVRPSEAKKGENK